MSRIRLIRANKFHAGSDRKLSEDVKSLLHIKLQAVQSACEYKLLTLPTNSPDLNLFKSLEDGSMKAPPRNSHNIKDLLLTSWCQIPKRSFEVHVLMYQHCFGDARRICTILGTIIMCLENYITWLLNAELRWC